MEGQVGHQKQGWRHMRRSTNLHVPIQQTSAYHFFLSIFVFVDRAHLFAVNPAEKMIIYLKFLHLKPFVYICAIKYAGGVN